MNEQDRQKRNISLAIAASALLTIVPSIGVPASVDIDSAKQAAQMQAKSADEEGTPQAVLTSASDDGAIAMGHRSHASHASHASHSSHRSGL